MLPGIDDGCTTVEESLQSIRSLKEHGFVGTICTPHCWPKNFPHITPLHIKAWRDALAQEIKDAAVRIIGEVRDGKRALPPRVRSVDRE